MIDVILWYPSNSKLAESYYTKNMGKFSPSEAEALRVAMWEVDDILYPAIGFSQADDPKCLTAKYRYFDADGAMNIVFGEK